MERNDRVAFEMVAKPKRGYTIHHIVVFVMTFVSYLQIYALRKTLSYVKSTIVDVWVPSNSSGVIIGDGKVYSLFSTVTSAETFMGALDSVFMFSYALATYFMGAISDRVDPRHILCFGMASAAILTAIFGFVTEVVHFYNAPFYMCVWILSGICQSAGWPSSVKLMDNWFGKEKRGLIFGVWSSGASVGSIVGAHICAVMLPYGYEYAFLVNASILLAIAVVLFFGVVSSPKDLEPPSEVSIEVQLDPSESTGASTPNEGVQTLTGTIHFEAERPKAVSFWKALLLPGVIAYALSYTCLKSVNYSIFFWLPYYMSATFGWDPSTSATLSTYYDWGGIVGSTVCGYASDLLGKRSPILTSMLGLAVCALGGYARSPDNKIINGLLMGIVGFFVSGATNLVSSAVTADLGRQKMLGNKEALSTVSGIIEGSGSAGAAIGQALLPLVAEAFGWNAIFYMFMIMLLISLVLLMKLCYRESREMVDDFQTRLLCLTSGIGRVEKLVPDIYVVAVPLGIGKGKGVGAERVHGTHVISL